MEYWVLVVDHLVLWAVGRQDVIKLFNRMPLFFVWAKQRWSFLLWEIPFLLLR